MSAWTRLRNRSGLYALPLVMCGAAWRFVQRKLRTWMLGHVYGLRIGRNTYIGQGVRFVNLPNIGIGDDVTIRNGVRFWSEVPTGRMTIASRVEVGSDVLLDFSGNLTLESDVLISEGALIYTHDHGHDPRSQPTASPLVIGEGAWIAARAIVLPSVSRIGADAIVGAGAVVARDVPDNAIYVGAGGRIVGCRADT